MVKCISAFVLFAFIIWILPLGIFIKPFQEKLTCGGQRAICLCTHLTDKKGQKPGGKILFQKASAAQKEQASSSGGAHQFFQNDLKSQKCILSSRHFENAASFYSLLICKSIEHIPKA